MYWKQKHHHTWYRCCWYDTNISISGQQDQPASLRKKWDLYVHIFSFLTCLRSIDQDNKDLLHAAKKFPCHCTIQPCT